MRPDQSNPKASVTTSAQNARMDDESRSQADSRRPEQSARNRRLLKLIARLGRSKFCWACDKWTWLQHHHVVRPFEHLLREEWRGRR